MKLQNGTTNRKFMQLLVSEGGALDSTGEDLMERLSATEPSVRALIRRFEGQKLLRVVGSNKFSDKRLYLLTDDIGLLAKHQFLLKEAVQEEVKPVSIECRAKQYVKERFKDAGLNRDVAVCVLKDFSKWDKEN